MPEEVRDAARERGVGDRLLRVLARRGVATLEELGSLVDPPESQLHDPMLLPDADVFCERVRRAAAEGDRAMVFGDFDADGLTGLAILTLALRRMGIDTEPYVPSRLEEGHGLSLGAVERARAEGRTLIVTADCGTTSVAEIAVAADAGIDVLVTDHHAVPPVLPRAVGIVNAHRPESCYPDPRLSGAGIAFKLACALLAGNAADEAYAFGLADLACIGSVADVVPISGENRAILRLGIRALATAARPGLAALMTAGGVDPRRVDVEQIGYSIAPRINAIGRIGQADAAARLLLTDDPAEAQSLAAELEAANTMRRDLMTTALDEARAALAADSAAASSVIVVAGPWPVGIVGLVAGRLADEHGVPAIVFSTTVEPWRGSARGVPGFDLACRVRRVRGPVRALRWPSGCGRLSSAIRALPGVPGSHRGVGNRRCGSRHRFDRATARSPASEPISGAAPAGARPRPARRIRRLRTLARTRSAGRGRG